MPGGYGLSGRHEKISGSEIKCKRMMVIKYRDYSPVAWKLKPILETDAGREFKSDDQLRIEGQETTSWPDDKIKQEQKPNALDMMADGEFKRETTITSAPTNIRKKCTFGL